MTDTTALVFEDQFVNHMATFVVTVIAGYWIGEWLVNWCITPSSKDTPRGSSMVLKKNDIALHVHFHNYGRDEEDDVTEEGEDEPVDAEPVSAPVEGVPSDESFVSVADGW